MNPEIFYDRYIKEDFDTGPKGYIFYEAKFRREPLWARMIDEETVQVIPI